ncbi:MAG: hypothetical protein MZV70_31215 [Desulfobacterales bacterium]|nr:hypothetical protein [Desulfobacterales bacterium]
MRSYSRRGIDCPVGVHYVGALGPAEPLGKMFGVLGISVEDLFYRMGSEGVIDRYLFDDFVFDLPVGLDAYEKNLREACPTDGAALNVVMKNLREIAGTMMDSSFFSIRAIPFRIWIISGRWGSCSMNCRRPPDCAPCWRCPASSSASSLPIVR